MTTKKVYVYGNVYYDVLKGVEIKVFYDDEITFTVPADMNIYEPHPELDAMVIQNATERVQQGRIGLSVTLEPAEWQLDYVVHNVDE